MCSQSCPPMWDAGICKSANIGHRCPQWVASPPEHASVAHGICKSYPMRRLQGSPVATHMLCVPCLGPHMAIASQAAGAWCLRESLHDARQPCAQPKGCKSTWTSKGSP